jgi:alcohol dehydrogenase (NADP+)
MASTESDSPPKTFDGWVAHSATTPLEYTTFEPKSFADTDVDIKISHCGVCGSDLHTIRSGWGPTDYPCVVGHEIVGLAERVGSQVAASGDIKVGDRVGVGPLTSSCRKPDCAMCSAGRENYCSGAIWTYTSRLPDGSKTSGGYAKHWRGPAHFVFRIPDSLPSAEAAPLLCGGLTVYSPLIRYGAGPGKTVGVIGVGGLGHLGILFAKALNCDRVVAISRTSSKRDDTLNGLGADAFIATDEPDEQGKKNSWAKTNSSTLDLIISTVSSPEMPLAQYLRLLKVDGTFVQLGAPNEPLPAIGAFSLIQKAVKLTGSNVGSPSETRQMLELAAQKRLLPWIQQRPMHEVNAVLKDFEAGKPRYRYVLVNEEDGQARL